MKADLDHEGARRAALAAVLVTAGSVLPAFLLGALAVQVRAELGFSKGGLGQAIAMFFGASALCSAMGGRFSERVGPSRAMRVACTGSALVLSGIAGGARSWGALMVLMAIGGSMNGISQPATNLLLARAIAAGRRGFAFGVKQSAIPLATLIGGVSVPLIALTVGWRWVFVFGALLAWGASRLVPDLDAPMLRPPTMGHRERMGPLVVLGIGAGCGAAAAATLGGFLVESGVSVGLSKGGAGMLLALGSAVNLATRLLSGRAADRRNGAHLRTVVMMLAVGSLGFLLLATGEIPLFILGTLVVFSAGWGWPGVFHFAVVENYPAAPGAATGITQTGVHLGGVAGPLVFGLLAEELSYGTAWLAAGGFVVLAAMMIAIGRRMIQRARVA